ncbi:hypothetical protein M199_gp151 [Halogranum tailed virus 1]|uniref:Uncharacterized protein n=1 Tax=Halogranum tailed virus 1 TaxID=1273749 RepID=R4T9C2_9CAUD|nr:hypothetical protein M199_gp151 [Halogranum tailed virus 1]AGM11515.1 hypothetical protein HGTV1_218 [Halogranum tailed virus 1]
MNSLKWTGDESIEDVQEPMRTLAQEGEEHALTKEIYLAINGHGSGHELTDDGYEYVGPTFDSEELLIIALAYRNDAKKMIELAQKT